MLAALGTFPQESEEPVEAEQVAEGQDVEEDAAPVVEAAQPATPAFLRDDEEAEAEDVSVEAEEPKDAAEDARSQFEEHLRAVRAQKLPRISLRTLILHLKLRKFIPLKI